MTASPSTIRVRAIINGHYQTVTAQLRRRLRPMAITRATPWTTQVVDAQLGPITLTGLLSGPGSGERVLIAIHGLGGSAESLYLREVVAAAERQGISVLRLNLRGADRRGEDVYHAGLTADLIAAIGSPGLAGFDQIAVLGYSLGGHMALRYATDDVDDPRVACVAAVCPPLDLMAAQRAIDRPGAWLYRRYVLGHMKAIFREEAARRSMPVSVAEAMRIQRMHEWDTRVTARRFGFAGAADYYRSVQVAGRLDGLQIPALVVATVGDPMVPAVAVRPALDAAATDRLDIRWTRGGHVAFDTDVDLGTPDNPRGLAHQLVGWLQSRLDQRT